MGVSRAGDSKALNHDEYELLLKAYELERLDDIQAASTMLALLAPTLGLLSLIGFALINADKLPKWLVALAPLPPLPFIAFGALYAHLAMVRGALVDRYEQELRLAVPNVRARDIPVPSGHQILGRIWLSAYGRSVIGLSSAALLSLYLVVVVISFDDARHEEPALAYFGLVFASVSTALLVGLFLRALWPERTIRLYTPPR